MSLYHNQVDRYFDGSSVDILGTKVIQVAFFTVHLVTPKFFLHFGTQVQESQIADLFLFFYIQYSNTGFVKKSHVNKLVNY